MASPLSDEPLRALASGRLQMFSAFRYREYRLFWLGGAFSNLGIWALMAGRLWLMHRLTDSAFMLGLVTVSSLGPILLLSMWGGVVADRVNRLRLVTITRAMFSMLAFLTGVLIVFDVIRPWQLIVISLATGVLLSFDIPSRQAILPNLVRRGHMLNAIVLYSFLGSGSAVIGPSLFGPLVDLGGLEGLFFFVGVAYASTVAMLLMMRPLANRADSNKGRPWEDLLKGLSYIRAHRAVVSLIAIGVVAGIFGMSFGTLLPIFADQILDGDLQTYSFLLLSMGVGGLVGTVALALFGNLKNSALLQLLSGVGFGLGLVVFSRISWFPASLAVIGLVGGASVVFMTINGTLMQSIVTDEFRGRVMSIHQLGWGASAIGGLLMGFLAQSVSAPFALTLSGAITAVAAGALTSTAVRGPSGEPETVGGD